MEDEDFISITRVSPNKNAYSRITTPWVILIAIIGLLVYAICDLFGRNGLGVPLAGSLAVMAMSIVVCWDLHGTLRFWLVLSSLAVINLLGSIFLGRGSGHLAALGLLPIAYIELVIADKLIRKS